MGESLRTLAIVDAVVGAVLFILAWVFADTRSRHRRSARRHRLVRLLALRARDDRDRRGLVRARAAAPGGRLRPARPTQTASGVQRSEAVALTLRYVVADVFTDTPLTGNQLAVFTDGREVDDATMQNLAREMNLSETRVRASGRGGRARAHPHLHARRRAAVRRASDARLGVRARAAAAALGDQARDRCRHRARAARARRPADHVRLDDAAGAEVAARTSAPTSCFGSSASSRSCRSTGTTSGRRSCTSRCARPTRWRRCGRTSRS